MYDLPHPSELLSSPLTKRTFKTTVKKSVIDYWEKQLRSEVFRPGSETDRLPSLEFFKPSFMSLTTPHPLWTCAGQSPAKVAMATIQALMISGRYRTEKLCSHWSRNRGGNCLLSTSYSEQEDLPHILSSCPALAATREKLYRYTLSYSKQYPAIIPLLQQFCTPGSPQFCQFLIDCSSLPPVILMTQELGKSVLHHLFTITRT